METAKKAKILYVLKILKEQTDSEQGITLPSLLDMLAQYGIQAERKSIYDDIRILTEFGFPIEKRKNKRFLYHYTSQKLTRLQTDMLSDALSCAMFVTQEEQEEIRGNIPQILPLIPSESPVFLVKERNQTHKLQLVYEAIRNHTCLSFQRDVWRTKKKKKEKQECRPNSEAVIICPQKFFFMDMRMILVGISLPEEAYCHFDVSDMQEMGYTDAPYLEADPEKLMKYIEHLFPTSQPVNEEMTMVCLREDFHEVMENFFPHCKTVIVKSGKSELQITGSAKLDFGLYEQLFRYGDTVKLIAPEKMVKGYREWIRKINKRYKEPN